MLRGSSTRRHVPRIRSSLFFNSFLWGIHTANGIQHCQRLLARGVIKRYRSIRPARRAAPYKAPPPGGDVADRKPSNPGSIRRALTSLHNYAAAPCVWNLLFCRVECVRYFRCRTRQWRSDRQSLLNKAGADVRGGLAEQVGQPLEPLGVRAVLRGGEDDEHRAGAGARPPKAVTATLRQGPQPRASQGHPPASAARPASHRARRARRSSS